MPVSCGARDFGAIEDEALMSLRRQGAMHLFRVILLVNYLDPGPSFHEELPGLQNEAAASGRHHVNGDGPIPGTPKSCAT